MASLKDPNLYLCPNINLNGTHDGMGTGTSRVNRDVYRFSLVDLPDDKACPILAHALVALRIRH